MTIDVVVFRDENARARDGFIGSTVFALAREHLWLSRREYWSFDRGLRALGASAAGGEIALEVRLRAFTQLTFQCECAAHEFDQ
ncbi:hypothetical protein ACQCQW_26645, partial [Ralstonia pseudosolanacearum]|uniref:hypothetical protein n=1 Tax=Ralstonia pseudosolanacearum TaxID=1310165 RepID=UPI003CF40E4F